MIQKVHDSSGAPSLSVSGDSLHPCHVIHAVTSKFRVQGDSQISVLLAFLQLKMWPRRNWECRLGQQRAERQGQRDLCPDRARGPLAGWGLSPRVGRHPTNPEQHSNSVMATCELFCVPLRSSDPSRFISVLCSFIFSGTDWIYFSCLMQPFFHSLFFM